MRQTGGSTESAVAEPDTSKRGTRASGSVKAAPLPLVPSDVDVGVTVVGTEAAGVARGLAAVGVGCEIVVPVASGAAGVDTEAEDPPGFPLLLLLV